MTLEQRIRKACNPTSGLTADEYERHVTGIVGVVHRAKRRRHLARAGVGDQAVTGSAFKTGEPVRPLVSANPQGGPTNA